MPYGYVQAVWVDKAIEAGDAFTDIEEIAHHQVPITAPALRAETDGERSEAVQCRSPVHAVVIALNSLT